MLTEALLEDARGIAGRITALRRAIHAEPELGLETPRTLAKVRAELADLPLEWREGPSCTGAVAVLNGGKAGRSVLLRGPSERAWWLRNDALDVRVEPSVHFRDGRQRPSHQVVLSGHLHADKGGRVRWKLTAATEG